MDLYIFLLSIHNLLLSLPWLDSTPLQVSSVLLMGGPLDNPCVPVWFSCVLIAPQACLSLYSPTLSLCSPGFFNYLLDEEILEGRGSFSTPAFPSTHPWHQVTFKQYMLSERLSRGSRLDEKTPC